MNASSLLLIGTGRAAFHLGHAFVASGVSVVGVVGRDRNRTQELATALSTTAFALDDRLPPSDVVLIAVSDDAIASVADQLPLTDAVVAHVSGARSLDVLERHPHRGVLWPVQTLGTGAPLDLRTSPVVVDGSDDRVRSTLLALAQRISDRALVLAHEQRRVVHLAATLTSNLPVFLAAEGQRLLREQGLPPDLLVPLWHSTAARVEAVGPSDALTGPARRGDVRTVQAHLDLLTHDPDLRRAYALLSDLILKAYGHGGPPSHEA